MSRRIWRICTVCKKEKRAQGVVCDACRQSKKRKSDPFRPAKPWRCSCGFTVTTQQCMRCYTLAHQSREKLNAV